MKRVMVVLIFFALIIACKRNPYRVNVSSVEVEIEMKRLEKDLFIIDPADIPENIPALRNKYGGFFQLFSYVINAGDVNDPLFNDLLVSFCTDRLNNEVYSAVMDQYGNLTWFEKEMEEAFRHYLWYFPYGNVPGIYTCITGFNNSIITMKDSILAVGLDRYLGRDCEYYTELNIYKYVSARMNSYNIVPDCMYAWGNAQWEFEMMSYPADNVMTEMIHEGKLRYFSRCMLPGISDTLLFGFTEDQMKFCINNEGRMWEYLVEHDLLFSTDQMTIRKLTGEAPFTSYFTSESPGRASVWLGYRIIESYMKNNTGTRLQDLMNETDIQGLLAKARYNPQ